MTNQSPFTGPAPVADDREPNSPADVGDVTDEDLEGAEEAWAEEVAAEDDKALGAFSESDYAARIDGWEFKSLALEVGEELEVEGYYRRPLDADPGTKWERIGHSRQPNALDLRRLIYCAEQRDLRAERRRERRQLIESLFGPGTEAVVDSLLASRKGDAAAGPVLTPRQEAFCRHFLTEPNATRAAILAGYGETGAAVEGHRMLRNAKILARITTLRRERGLSYCFDRDSLLDRLEWVFGEAMEGRDYTTAIRALLAQAQMFGIGAKRHAATERAEAKAREAIEKETAAAARDEPA